MKAKQWGIGIKIRKGLRIVQRQGGIWYREERLHGRIVRKSLETMDEKQAMQKAVAGMEEPARTFRGSKLDQPSVTIEKAFEAYSEWFTQKRRASNVRVTLPLVESFIDAVGAEKSMLDITREAVQGWIDGRVDGRSPITVKNDFGRIRAFVRWAERKYRSAVDVDAVRGVDLPKDRSVTKAAPDMETMRAILRALKPHPWLGDYATCLLEIGCRPGELLGVRGVDLRDNLLSIRPWGDWELKSKWSARTIQITETAAAILNARREKLFDKSWPIFGQATGKMRDPRTVGQMYRLALKDEKGEVPSAFRPVWLYMFRHAFCSLHAQPGPAFMDLPQLGAYIGHGAGSTFLLERFYVDRDALRRGAPVSLLGEKKDGKLVEMRKSEG